MTPSCQRTSAQRFGCRVEAAEHDVTVVGGDRGAVHGWREDGVGRLRGRREDGEQEQWREQAGAGHLRRNSAAATRLRVNERRPRVVADRTRNDDGAREGPRQP
jgi:hypothetical protein